jgi:hypothetical protein
MYYGEFLFILRRTQDEQCETLCNSIDYCPIYEKIFSAIAFVMAATN